MNRLTTLVLLLCFAFVTANAQITWENFEDQRKADYFFVSGTFIPYYENPDQSGNTSLIAAQYTRNPSEQYDVIVLEGAMADLADYTAGSKQMSIDVWSPRVGVTVQITLENNQVAEPANYPAGRHSVYLATTSVANQWETLTFSFDNTPDPAVTNTEVNTMVLLFDPGTNTADTYYWDNLVGPELANDPCEGVAANPYILNDFECHQNVRYIFNHSTINFRRLPNPDPNGANTSSHVATYTRNAGEEFDVIIGRLADDFPESDHFTIDVWSENAPVDLLLSFQNDDGSGAPVVIQEATATINQASTWQTLNFNLPGSVTRAQANNFVMLLDPGNFTSYQYYFDNFTAGSAAGIEEVLEVNTLKQYPNPAKGHTTFEYELTQTAHVNLSIQNQLGQTVKTLVDTKQVVGTQKLTADLANIPTGMYFYTLTIDGHSISNKLIIE